MIIICDIDDTLCDTISTWCKHINADKGTNYTSKDVKSWEIAKELNLSRYEVFKHLDTRRFYADIKPFCAAQKVLKMLQNDGDKIIFVTARIGRFAEQETYGWIDKHFDGIGEDVIFESQKWRINGDALIDDNIENLNEYHIHHPESWVGCLETHANRNQKMIHGKKYKTWFAIYKEIQCHKNSRL